MNVLSGADRLSGILFILIGVGFLWFARDFGFGTMFRMGAGFFPIILSVLLIALGAVITVRSLVADQAVSLPRFGPMAKVIAAMVVFAAFMQPLGSYITLPVVVILAAWASPAFKWRSAIPLAIGTTICSDLIFRVALGLPMYAVGSWLGN